MSKKSPHVIVEGLIKKFDPSGHTEMQVLVELCKDHIGNEKFDKAELDQDSLKLLDSIFADVIDAARTIRLELHTKAGWYGTPLERIELKNAAGEGPTMGAFVTIAPHSIGIGFDGHGVCHMEPDTELLMVEQTDFKPRVIVWDDINNEEASHTIDLDGAKQSKREEGP